MKKLLVGIGFACFFLIAAMPLMADDDFSGRFLDPLIWQDFDIARYVDQDENLLISGVRSARPGDLNRNGARFASPNSLYGIRSKIRMSIDTNVVQNSINTAEAGARITGVFYNRDSASPGNHVGDVVAVVEIRDRGAGLEAWCEVVAYNNYPASVQSDYDFLLSQRLDTGGLSKEVFYIAQLEYDTSTNEIRGALYDESMNPIGSATYTIANYLGPAFEPLRILQTFAYHDTALASADFDDVHIQSAPGGAWAPYDDFNGGFDPGNWTNGEVYRAIDNNQLVLGVGDDGNSKKTVKAHLVDLPDYLEALVTLSSETLIESEPGVHYW